MWYQPAKREGGGFECLPRSGIPLDPDGTMFDVRGFDEGARGGESPARVLRVLVVEDEPDIAALVAYQLTREGYRVETALDGDEAVAAIGRELPDLVVLDRMLPGLSGDEILRGLRAESRTRRLPVLLLTARREEGDRIEGFELGADDYLTKPFSPRELALRVRSILRRSEGGPADSGGRLLTLGRLVLDEVAHDVTLNGELLDLTPTEFRLLQTLLSARGRTQSRQRLLEQVWEVQPEVAERLQTRTVDMHIHRLRGKLGEMGDYLETVRGFGYRLREPVGTRS